MILYDVGKKFKKYILKGVPRKKKTLFLWKKIFLVMETEKKNWTLKGKFQMFLILFNSFYPKMHQLKPLKLF